ncbi:MAG: AI-2E family transporter [Myxococcota bacterium]
MHSSAGAAVTGVRRPAPARTADGWSRLRWGLAFAAVGSLVVWLTWSVFWVLAASAVIAYLLHPAVARLEARGYTREWGIAILAAVGGALGLAVALVVIPGFVKQFAELVGNIRPYLETASERVGPLIARVEQQFGIDVPVDLRELGEVAPDLLKKVSPDMRARIQEVVTTVAGGGLQVILSVLSISLLPVFTFYFLRDWPHLIAMADDLVPVRHRPLVRRLAGEIDGRIGAFVRGQLTVAAILACLYTVGLLISGIDLALTMGFLSGVLFLLPYLGPVVAGTISILLALLKFGLDWHVGAVVATYALGQVLENTFLTPMLVGDRVGLHPMVVMVALIVAGNLLGIWGLVVALPLTAAVFVIGAEAIAGWKRSRTYAA